MARTMRESALDVIALLTLAGCSLSAILDDDLLSWVAGIIICALAVRLWLRLPRGYEPSHLPQGQRER